MQKFDFMQKGVWSQFIAKLNGMFNQKADKTEIPVIPDALKNPYPVTFGGIIPEVSYDGSKQTAVNFPSVEMSAEAMGTPVGEILAYMGNTPPENYLACNGAVYNIADYPELAQHFITEFGASNHFGGDGEITFAVPDLRGEFLRGTGTNGHENSGNGANVGNHQIGTTMPYLGRIGLNTIMAGGSENAFPSSVDINIVSDDNGANLTISNSSTNTNKVTRVGVRPPNTSVLYCIKYRPTHFINVTNHTYSLEERRIGYWIDEKPLYEKTFAVYDLTTNFTHNIPDIDIGWVYTGFVDGVNGLYFNSLPFWAFLSVNKSAMVNLTKTQIQLDGNSFNSQMVGYFVVRYTKTTD